MTVETAGEVTHYSCSSSSATSADKTSLRSSRRWSLYTIHAASRATNKPIATGPAGRLNRYAHTPDTESEGALAEVGAPDPVTVMDQISRLKVPGCGSDQLPPDPSGSRGDDDLGRARLLGGDQATETARPGTEDDDGVARPGPGIGAGPAHAPAEGVPERGDAGREVAGQPVHDRVRVQVEVLGVACGVLLLS